MENYLFSPKRENYLVNGAFSISIPANLNLSLNLILCLDEYSSNLYSVVPISSFCPLSSTILNDHAFLTSRDRARVLVLLFL